MIALMLLLVVIADTAITGYLLATIKGLKRSIAHNARLIKSICEEDESLGREPDADVDD